MDGFTFGMVMVVVLVVIMGQGSDICDVSGDIYGLGGDSDDSDFFYW